MAATQKIAVHSLSGRQHLTMTLAQTNAAIDLKNTTDDALPNYLHSLKFKQIHTQTDVRLVLGYVAVAIAGALFYFDWKFGWDASKPYTAPAVVAYFILNGAFSYWLWFVEKGVVYEGQGKTGTVRTPYSCIYIIVLTTHSRSAFPRTQKSIFPSTNATSSSQPRDPASHRKSPFARP
jgi:hypothetical protein